MPPKITDLVKYFEQQQQESSGSPTQGSRVSARATSTSPVAMWAQNTGRRVSAPVLRAAAGTGLPSSPALPRSSSASVITTNAVVNAPTRQDGRSVAARPKQPLPAQVAAPEVSATNITNVKASDAARAIVDKLQATTGIAAASGKSSKASDPPPIKDRFLRPAGAAAASKGQLSSIQEDEPITASSVAGSRSLLLLPLPAQSAINAAPGSATASAYSRGERSHPEEGEKPAVKAASVSSPPPTFRTFDSARTLVMPSVDDEAAKPRRVSLPITEQSSGRTEASGQASSRPSLPNSTSNGKLSTYTVDVPAHDVFLPNAQPLELPLLDDYIENLPRIQFSDPAAVMCGAEKEGWAEWLAGKPRQRGWLASLRQKLSFGSYEQTATVELDDKLGKPSIQAAKRALMFPPMHRIPPDLTVTDLKHNQRSKALPITLNSLLSLAINAVLGASGSAVAVSLMRVEVFRDLVQLLGTGVNFAVPSGSRAIPSAEALRNSGASQPQVIMLSMVPSILGLDFVSAFGKSILWLWLFSLLCFSACWEFKGMAGGWRCKAAIDYTERQGEGLDSEEAHIRRQQGWRTRLRSSRAYRTSVVFLITSLYLPLSKISIGALAWTSDYWPVENYYADTDDPEPSLLGSPDAFREPLDFCYTTTMRKEGFNWAIPILIVAALTVIVVTIWFPIRLWLVVRSEVPKVDPFTELGEARKDKRAEYERLLDRDSSPFAFVYNEYRREWAGFKSAYMALKLINVLCITLLTKDNCLFRGHSRDTLNVIRQSTLLGFMFSWMALQIWARPFIDKLSNNSDWCSRSSYVIIAILGLAAALKLPGQSAYSGWLLVSITVISFLFNGYFSAIGTGFAQNRIKIWQQRLDFSIDIFSPHLDMPKHIARRIQQETISTLLLAEPEYRIKDKAPLVFGTVATSSDVDDCPPYLLAYQGTQGERHVENIKILREVGLQSYVFSVDQMRVATRRDLHDRIMRGYTGPDCFWQGRDAPRHCSFASCFGRASVIPFPFTLVFRFDITNRTVCITEEPDLISYLEQNEGRNVRAARRVRLALRALDGKRCFAPFREPRTLGRFRRRSTHVSVDADVQFTFCTLKIGRNTCFNWRGYNYNSGFNVQLHYSDGRLQRADGTLRDSIARLCDGSHIGLGNDFSLSPALATFFRNNRDLLDVGIPEVEKRLSLHRHFFAEEAAWKRHVLSYSFLVDVYGNDRLDSKSLEEALDGEADERTRMLVVNHRGAFNFLRERMDCVNRDVVTQWWYCAWDDIWRRNHRTISQLEQHEQDFSPAYQTSICYRPMSRDKLKEYLDQRGLWPKPRKKGFFNNGVLNRIYYYLDQSLFAGTKAGIPLKVGRHRHSVDFHELENLKPFDAEDSFGRHTVVTFDTGQGTDHDESTIRNRPRFQFEDIYERKQASTSFATLRTFRSARERAGEGVRAWLGLSPYERTNPPPGIYFSLRDVEGTYRAPRAK